MNRKAKRYAVGGMTDEEGKKDVFKNFKSDEITDCP